MIPYLWQPSVRDEDERENHSRLLRQSYARMAAALQQDAPSHPLFAQPFRMDRQNLFRFPLPHLEISPDLNGQELRDHVHTELESGQHVSPELARRYLNHINYGGFREIDPVLDAGGITGLPLVFKLALYESIAQEVHPNNVRYLSALNAEMGLGDDFYAREANASAAFFSQKNLMHLRGTRPEATQGIVQLLTEYERTSDQDKAKYLQKICDAYCDFCEMPHKRVICTNDPDKLLNGYYQPYADSIVINLNADAYRQDPVNILETLIHEARHSKQCSLAAAYRNGELPPSHPSYIAARVFYANLQTAGGYINFNYDYSGYHGQPAEIDARNAGDAAMAALRKNFRCLLNRPQTVAPFPNF